ncbi:MAG: signal peptidase II, partial [Ignavibacterium sp.]
VIYLYVIRDKSLSLRIAIACILGGAVGNLIDRTFYGVFFDYAPLFYGKVVDFFDFDFFNFTLFGRSYDRWPVFNIADAAVTIGVLILILFYKKHNEIEEVSENKVEVSGISGINISEKVSELSSDNPQIIKKDQINEQTDIRKEISD